MRINLSVTDEEVALLEKAADFQSKVIPGSNPKITGVAKSCMISGLRELLSKADNVLEMEKVKKKK